jgi:predicted membrane protein
MLELAGIVKMFLVVLHLTGMAALLGGFLVQIKALRAKTAEILPAMVHGAWTSLLTGILLVAVHYWELSMGSTEVLDNSKIAIKTVVVLIVLTLVTIHRKKKPVSGGVLGTVGALTFLNVVLAVFW